MADFSWPYADSCVCIVALAVCSLARGCLSTAISWLTMPLTSRPLPMPADEMVAVALVREAMEGSDRCGGRGPPLALFRQVRGRLERGRGRVDARCRRRAARTCLLQQLHDLAREL